MMASTSSKKGTPHSFHVVGVVSGLAAGAWLGAAEAPTELVTTGLSPFMISFTMVLGVFVARWTVPTLIKGTGFIMTDLLSKPHLLIWAVIAGSLWAVANTLTIFAIRDVGLSIAFPIWNCNCLVGLFWGWLLFNELKGSGAKDWCKVVGGAFAIVTGTVLMAYVSAGAGGDAHTSVGMGIGAALGAGLLYGTMYVPYRKAYISGMNPLSFVTVFTIGEIGAMLILAPAFLGGFDPLWHQLVQARPVIFWLFLGGFCWVIGDLFQQFAAKYIGIGRGIPLANTNQLWGLAWGALVFGELAGRGSETQFLVVIGSLIMIAGAAAISTAEASAEEHVEWEKAMLRECRMYGLDPDVVRASMVGEGQQGDRGPAHRWWDILIVIAAIGVFVWLAMGTERPPIHINPWWSAVLILLTACSLVGCGFLLWKRTNFS